MNYVKLVEETLSRFGLGYRVVKTKGVRCIRVYPFSSIISASVLNAVSELPSFCLIGVTMDGDNKVYALYSY